MAECTWKPGGALPVVGDTFREPVRGDDRHDHKWRVFHVRAIVDDDVFILRHWSWRHKSWLYSCAYDYEFTGGSYSRVWDEEGNALKYG